MHYFASQYYGARGLLSNLSHTHERKRRRKAGDVHDADEDADDLFAEDEEDSEKNDVEEELELHEGDVVKDRVGGEKMKENAPDMYKALDGSALVAIGTHHFRRLHIQN